MSAYRMTTHKVTQVTPNLAMLGREVLLPATLIVKPPEEPVDTTVPFVNDLRDHIKAAHAQVRQTTLQAAKTQKTYYDSRSKGLKFAIGQKVWLYWPSPPRRQRYRKLQQVWTGPWTILDFKNDVVVELQRLTPRQSRYTTHIDRLSPYKGTDCPVSTKFSFPEEGTPSSTHIEHQAQSPAAPVPCSAATRPQRTRRLAVALEPYVVG